MKLLWILPKWPLPANDGAKQAHMALLREWPKEFPLDLAVYSDEEISEQQINELKFQIGFRQLLILPKPKNTQIWKRLWAITQSFISSLFFQKALPMTIQAFANKMAQAKWKNWSEKNHYTHIFFDGLHTGALFWDQNDFHFPKNTKLMTRMHNNELALWQQTAEFETRFFIRKILKRESRLVEFFQTKMLEKQNQVFPVSDVDAKQLQSLSPSLHQQVIPIGFDWPQDFHPNSQKKLSFLYVGKLNWLPNQEGLLWFLNSVWPKAQNLNPQIELKIIGSNPSPELIQTFSRLKNQNVDYLGTVENLEPYYQDCCLALIPILSGSGTRVKAIEAARYGRSFIATAKGVEGLPIISGKHYLRAESAEEWIAAIQNLSGSSCHGLGNCLFQELQINYDRKNCQNKLLHALASEQEEK